MYRYTIECAVITGPPEVYGRRTGRPRNDQSPSIHGGHSHTASRCFFIHPHPIPSIHPIPKNPTQPNPFPFPITVVASMEDTSEVKWTDACIRWTEDDLEPHMRPSWAQKQKQKNNNSNNDDDNNNNAADDDDHDDDDDDTDTDTEEGFMDPFTDPNPTQEFIFEYPTKKKKKKVTTKTNTSAGMREDGVNDDENGDDDNDDDDNYDMVRINVVGYKTDADETWESTGVTIWRATHILNDYIHQHYDEWTGYSILELGAGLGVCGILTYKLIEHSSWIQKEQQQHQHVPSSSSSSLQTPVSQPDYPHTPITYLCLTDGDTQALAWLRKNVQRNNCNMTSSSDSSGGSSSTTSTRIQVRQLLWGRETAQRFTTTTGTTTTTTTNTTTLTDQAEEELPSAAATIPTTDGVPSNYQIILASDIIYAPQVLVPLWETIQVLLTQEEHGRFILAFAKRNVPVQVEDVLQTANDYGFEYTSHRTRTTSTTTTTTTTDNTEYADEEKDLFLYEFKRKR